MFFHCQPIVRPAKIPERMAQQELDIWICSYGGSGTNMLADYLASKSFVVRTPIWHELICHHRQPINVQRPTKAIYLFGDPVLAFNSMKRRRSFPEVNLSKLTNRREIRYSDQRLFQAMLKQFLNWTRPNRTNVDILIVKFEDLFTTGKGALADFLETDIHDFPLRQSRRTTDVDQRLPPGLRRFRRQVEAIRSFPSFKLNGAKGARRREFVGEATHT